MAGWIPELEDYCALKFAPPEVIAELLIEAVTLALADGKIDGVVRMRGLLDCSAALPLDEHRHIMTSMKNLHDDLSKHLACGAGCLVLDLYAGSLFDALYGRAPGRYLPGRLPCCAGQGRCASAAPKYCAELTCLCALRRQLYPRHSPVTRAAWACQLFTALRNLHTRLGVIHGDIKPPNLLVSGEGADTRLAIADFGRAQSADCGRSNLFFEMCAHLTDATACLNPNYACMSTVTLMHCGHELSIQAHPSCLSNTKCWMHRTSMLGINKFWHDPCFSGLASAHAVLKPYSVRARYQLHGSLLGTPGYEDPDAVGAKQDGVAAAITLMELLGAGRKLSAPPPSLGARSLQVARVCIVSSSKHGENPAARHKAISLTVLGPVAAVKSQEDAGKGIHANNKKARARASIGAAKDYVDLVLTSTDHFEAAHRTWADLPKEVCP